MTDFPWPAHLYVDRQGNPVDLWQWVELFEIPVYRTIEFDEVGTIAVSTVWTGMSHAPFETMVFVDGQPIREERYFTEEDARVGHELILADVYPEHWTDTDWKYRIAVLAMVLVMVLMFWWTVHALFP